MSDVLINMVASQLGIPSTILSELKATKVEMVKAMFDNGDADLTLRVTQPDGPFVVFLSLPVEKLQRLPAVYRKAVELANGH